MNFRSVAAAVVGVALLPGCTAVNSIRDVVTSPETPLVAIPEPTDAPADDPDMPVDPTVVPSEEPSSEMVRGLDGEMKPRASAESITPDAALMAEMTCEQLSADTAGRIYSLWGDPVDEAVQVEVGPGLDAEETWWFVAYWATTEELGPRLHERLTNHPDRAVGEHGQWFVIDERFDNIHWDAERLVRAQSARSKALSCLRSS